MFPERYTVFSIVIHKSYLLGKFPSGNLVSAQVANLVRCHNRLFMRGRRWRPTTLMAYVLVRRGGYRVKEVAEYFGRNPTTISSLLSRYEHKMREQVKRGGSRLLRCIALGHSCPTRVHDGNEGSVGPSLVIRVQIDRAVQLHLGLLGRLRLIDDLFRKRRGVATYPARSSSNDEPQTIRLDFTLQPGDMPLPVNRRRIRFYANGDSASRTSIFATLAPSLTPAAATAAWNSLVFASSSTLSL